LCSKVDFREDFLEMGLGILDGTVVEDVIVGSGDRTTFFEVFDLGDIAFTDGLGVKGAIGALGDAFVA